MRILVVGGAGYVGGYLVDILSKKHEVHIYDNLTYETRWLKPGKFIYGDIRDFQKLNSIIHDYQAVVWLAALVGDPACSVDISLTEDLNFNTVKWLVDNYKGKIYFCSTCSVYGVNNNLIDETAQPNPLSAYAATKLKAEQYIINNSNDYLIFRLGTLYGLSDTYSRLRLDLVVNILTRRAVQKEKLIVTGESQWRPLLHVKDVGLAFDYCISNKINGLYNLSSINLKISEIAEKIQEIVPDSIIEFRDLKFEDQRNYRVSNDKILSTGWTPKHSLDAGVLELKKLFEENRVKDLNDPIYSNGHFIKMLYGKEK
jgi:nucleoside-diphosphate-sugar epimerase